jgi:hypothetical protein
LQYLTFECFAPDIDDQKIDRLALVGHLSFQDYAVAKWAHHLRAVVGFGQEILSKQEENFASLAELESALDDFTNRYEEETLLQDNLATAIDACGAFQRSIIYDNLLSLWSHISRHEQKGPKARNEVSLQSLAEALTRNREVLEKLPARSSHHSPNLNELYGENLFKCPKVTCHYFHEGFKDEKSRKAHINRHDRPFLCTVDDCLGVESGFSSNKDLEKHMRAYHFEISDLAETFTPKKTPPATTPFKCPTCSKAFTRKFHLQSHERNHSGEKPFACDECGKAFTRSNDMRRHKKIHTRR